MCRRRRLRRRRSSTVKQIGNNNVREINLIMFLFASIHSLLCVTNEQ